MDKETRETVVWVLVWLTTVVVMLAVGYQAGYERAERNAMEFGAMKKAGEGMEGKPCVSIWMRVTAYCPCEKCCGEWSDGVTASGHKIRRGDRFVASGPEYKFGTMVEVPGYGKVPVLDRGGAIKGNRLDVFFPTHQEALEWGVKQLVVSIEQ